MAILQHPEPEKLARLLARRKAGIPWTEEDFAEFRILIEDWIRLYRALQNTRKVKYYLRLKTAILKEHSRCKRNEFQSPSDAANVANALRMQLETW
jgi:hypothetical protein